MLNTGGELTLAREMTLGVWGPLLLITRRELTLARGVTLGIWGPLLQITGRELTLAREMTLTYKGILVLPAEICHLGGVQNMSFGEGHIY